MLWTPPTQTALQCAKVKYVKKHLMVGGVDMNITSMGIDLAKTNFSVVGMNQAGKIVLRKTLKRDKLLAFIAQCPPCLIGMEACSGAHYWG